MLRRLHHWIGLFVAGWLVVATVSGILLLFEDEYYAWRYPALPDAPAVFAPDGNLIASIVANSPRRITAIGQPTKALPAYHVYFADGGEALYHPESARQVAAWDSFDALPAFLFDLHVYMLLGEAGHVFVGVIGLFAVTNICVGLALWWRRRSTFRLRFMIPRDMQKKHLIRGHAAQGAAASLALIVTLLSGSAIIFPGPTMTILKGAFGAADTLRPTVSSIAEDATSVDWGRAISAAADRFPDAALRFVTVPAAPDQPLVLRLKNAAELHPNGRSYAVIHPATGDVLESIDATQTGLGPAVFDALYPIHAGKTGWPAYRLLLTLLSLSLLYVVISGSYLYLRRARLSRRVRPAGLPLRP